MPGNPYNTISEYVFERSRIPRISSSQLSNPLYALCKLHLLNSRFFSFNPSVLNLVRILGR